METKKDIRTRILKERKLMSYEDWWAKSHIICKKVTTHPFFLSSKEICCYIDVQNEVGTREIIETAWKQGKKVAAPRICGDDMRFFYFHSFDELKDDTYHIPAPSDLLPADSSSSLIIMPGAVFDKKRHRIGYGKGYYDRYLNIYSGCKTIAIAFENQVLTAIPFESHDKCPDYLITEEKIYGEEFTE